MPQVVLELPDEVFERAESEARKRHRSTEGILMQAVLSGMETGRWLDADLSGLPDDALEALIRKPMPADTVRRMDELSVRNTSGTINQEDRAELERLLGLVHTSTMLKALALVAWKDRHGKLPDQIGCDF